MNPLLVRILNAKSRTLIMVGMAMLLLLTSSSPKVVDAVVAPIIAKPGCKDTCGNVRIPFPFGIGDNCSLDSRYEIKCNTSAGSTKAFLSKFDIEVMEITLPDYDNKWLQNMTVAIPSLGMCSAHQVERFSTGIDFRGSPYNFSTDHNVFITKGCAGSATLINESNTTISGCGTICRNRNSSAIFTNKCYGVECCQMSLPTELSLQDPTYYSPFLYSGFNNWSISSPLQFYQIGFCVGSSGQDNNCLVATLMKKDSMDEYISKLSTPNPPTVPVLLYWSWFSKHHLHDSNPNAKCVPGVVSDISHCYCNGNSVGNPYLSNGCQVPKECKDCLLCTWNAGNSSYNCLHLDVLSGLRIMEPIMKIVRSTIVLILLIVIGTLFMTCGCCWLCHFIKKRRRKTNKRVKFFKLKLQQHQSSNEDVMERAKLFTYKQLDKATDHFNENRILGKGGQGTVYKGMLTDGTIVAVKTSKLMDESQMEQFINEVVILSQINHRHVVKLLGCCLEREVPLLVYEFISNGTLSKHLHDPDDEMILSWPMRLKIASDSAGAIAYLHSSSSTPIFHRDIKPANILLDDKQRAKVSDFGSSKTIALDQTHVTTLVQGTIGYLDPEYFETNMFTDKSDVYSFGVVLLELLTSKKPIYRTETMEQKSLVVEFFLSVQNCSVFDILDPEFVNEANKEELIAAIDLARHCLNGSGRLRPTMKEVVMRLEIIIKSPAEISSRDNQSFPNERFGETEMPETSKLEFMSSPVPTGVGSPLYIDVQPLLHDTI